MINATARRGLERSIGRYRLCGEKWRSQRGAHSGHLAKQFSLLLLVLGIVSVVTACGGNNEASPAATSGTNPPPTSSTIATPTSDTLSRGEVARLFYYDRRPLAITRLGLTARLPPTRELDGVTVHSITYASPKGGEVPALVAVPNGKGPFPGVIVQHGLPDTKEGMLPAGIDLARTGALAILIDAPFNRPQQGRVRSDPLTLTPKDRDEQIQLIVDLRRAIDMLAARPDVNNKQLAYFGVSYGAAMGGLLAGVEDRITAYVAAALIGGPAATPVVTFAAGTVSWLVPLALGASVLRYRLYELDRIISRTLAYGLLTLLLAGGYALVALVLGRLLGRDSSLVVAAATLAVAALFQPARRRIQQAVDRRFNRRHYDAAHTVAAFSARLRQHVDLDSLTAELLAVAEETMQPTQSSLWLQPSDSAASNQRMRGTSGADGRPTAAGSALHLR